MPTQAFLEFAKDTWVPALRSGEYKQTTGYLRRGFGYCCLGVLCEIFPGVTFDQESESYTYGDDESSDKILPQNLAEELKIDEDPAIYVRTEKGRHISGGKNVVRLALANDEGMTFAEIAEIIEAAIEGVHLSFDSRS